MAQLLKIGDVELSLEQKIADHLGSFDLIALLRLLKSEGFKTDDIWFSSHNSIASQNRVIESVRLRNHCAFIQLNLGLLAATGFIPEHIRQFMEKPDVNDQGLEMFFQLFDHLLISSYLGQLYPEINKTFFDYWPQTKKCYTQLQNMHSECSLHWLFECAFPEFVIVITRSGEIANNISREQVLGRIVLGENDDSFQPYELEQFKIYLVQRPDWNGSLQDWLPKVSNRLQEWVFPWLNALSISLDVHLCMYSHGMHLKLHNKSILGYDALFNQGDVFTKEEKSYPLHCFAIHRGLVSDHMQNTPAQHAQQDKNLNTLNLYAANVETLTTVQSHEIDFIWEESCRLQL